MAGRLGVHVYRAAHDQVADAIGKGAAQAAGVVGLVADHVHHAVEGACVRHLRLERGVVHSVAGQHFRAIPKLNIAFTPIV